MQIKQISKQPLKHEYSVAMTAEEIDVKLVERLQEIGKDLKVPGFRQGKVPMNVLKTKYAKAVMGEVLEKAVDESVMKAINENSLRPAMQPKVEVQKFDEKEGMECTVAIELLPEISLMDFTSIKLEKLTAKPQDKEVEETLKRIGSSSKESKRIETKRKSKTGDIVVIDFDGTVNGERQPGMKGDNFNLELGSKSFVDTFEDQLTGKEEGAHLEVKVTFPEDYGHEPLRGVAAVFAVDIKEIREVTPPTFDDTFAKKFGFDSIDKLKEAVKEQMSGEYDRLTRLDTKRKLLDAMDAKHDFEVPQGMVDAEFYAIWQQLKGTHHPDDPHHHGHGHAEHSHPKEDYGTAEENKEYRDIAKRRVKLGLVLAEAGRINKVEITTKELQQAVVAEARRYPGQEAKVFEFYQKNPQALEALKAPIYEDKVVDYIISVAKVEEKEVSIDALNKAVEEADDIA